MKSGSRKGLCELNTRTGLTHTQTHTHTHICHWHHTFLWSLHPQHLHSLNAPNNHYFSLIGSCSTYLVLTDRNFTRWAKEFLNIHLDLVVDFKWKQKSLYLTEVHGDVNRQFYTHAQKFPRACEHMSLKHTHSKIMKQPQLGSYWPCCMWVRHRQSCIDFLGRVSDCVPHFSKAQLARKHWHWHWHTNTHTHIDNHTL